MCEHVSLVLCDHPRFWSPSRTSAIISQDFLARLSHRLSLHLDKGTKILNILVKPRNCLLFSARSLSRRIPLHLNKIFQNFKKVRDVPEIATIFGEIIALILPLDITFPNWNVYYFGLDSRHVAPMNIKVSKSRHSLAVYSERLKRSWIINNQIYVKSSTLHFDYAN